MDYTLPKGMHTIPLEQLDLRPDSEIDHDILHPKPITDEKNVWFFWHSGFATMHLYSQRGVRAWYRRLSKLGWTIRILDMQAGSPLNVANFLDVTDTETFPKTFTDGTIGGEHARQHTSDLVRFPLLLKYGGVYADVGMLQIGDLDRLWNQTVGDPNSPYEVLTYSAGEPDQMKITNYFLCSGRKNPLFLRAHKLFLALWNEDGGKSSTEGMHASPLLKGVPMPLQGSFTENGRTYTPDEASSMLTDYITQGQACTMAMAIEDPEDGWNGPEYVAKHVYAIEFMVGAQLINEYTQWNGKLAFDLMSLSLRRDGERESAQQAKAREIVENCLSRSFGFKLATGIILRVLGDTLSSLWRKNVGSDNVPGTYAHWLRHGTIYWTQDRVPPPIEWRSRHTRKDRCLERRDQSWTASITNRTHKQEE
ncbi:capsule polysaccharide biosynthesis [Seiridium cupressi]